MRSYCIYIGFRMDSHICNLTTFTERAKPKPSSVISKLSGRFLSQAAGILSEATHLV